MQEILQRWLARRPAAPGVIACGICFADQDTASRNFQLGSAEEPLKALWTEAAEALHQMPALGARTGMMRWVFTRHVLYAVTREDGACLGILAERNEEASGRAGILGSMAEFKALKEPSPAPQS
jgi:hypothetical protein